MAFSLKNSFNKKKKKTVISTNFVFQTLNISNSGSCTYARVEEMALNNTAPRYFKVCTRHSYIHYLRLNTNKTKNMVADFRKSTICSYLLTISPAQVSEHHY